LKKYHIIEHGNSEEKSVQEEIEWQQWE